MRGRGFGPVAAEEAEISRGLGLRRERRQQGAAKTDSPEDRRVGTHAPRVHTETRRGGRRGNHGAELQLEEQGQPQLRHGKSVH